MHASRPTLSLTVANIAYHVVVQGFGAHDLSQVGCGAGFGHLVRGVDACLDEENVIHHAGAKGFAEREM